MSVPPTGHSKSSSGEKRAFVVLGVTAGIAAYKAVEICRLLVDAKIHVAPVLTERTDHFVGVATFDALATEPARSSLWDGDDPSPHTRLGRRADLIVIAPATADFLARYAAGMANDLLTATLLATAAPVIVCPAMHTEMWEHPAVRHNLGVLTSRGVSVVPPEDGRLAGGDIGAGRLAAPSTVVGAVLDRLGLDPSADGERAVRVGDATRRAPHGPDGDLTGKNVVVTAGGTREPIDAVRFITNRSSGRQGHALAGAARRRGGEVVLVTTSGLDVGTGISVVRVDTAADMESAVLAAAGRADVVIMAAAVADFRPKVASPAKLHKADGVPELVLEPTPDILSELGRRRRPGQVLVGFAAETEQVGERAQAKLGQKGVDLMVANDVSAPDTGFDHETNEVTIFGADGAAISVALASKDAVADAVLARVCELLGGQ